MSAAQAEEDFDDLLPDDLTPKGKAAPLVRTKQQTKALAKRAEKDALKEQAARLAQIVNLHIAGYSLAQIGAAVGSTADEIDRLLSADMARYVRSQPALRIYVRNWVSSKYMKMIEADWEAASDVNHREKLENQDRVMRMLDRMAKLHGAEAPTQSEVTLDAAPEAVEKLVNALAAGQGLGYDAGIFDIVDAEVVHEAVDEAEQSVQVSGNAVEQVQEGDDDGF